MTRVFLLLSPTRSDVLSNAELTRPTDYYTRVAWEYTRDVSHKQRPSSSPMHDRWQLFLVVRPQRVLCFPRAARSP
jgi:hypothetical protein